MATQQPAKQQSTKTAAATAAKGAPADAAQGSKLNAEIGKDGQARVTVTSPVGRVSFPSLLKPDTGREFSDEKYKVTLLFPKTDKEGLAVLKEAVQAVAAAKWPGVNLKQIATPFRNGDEKEDWDGYPGHIFITAKSKQKPGLVGPTKKSLGEGEEIYGGCYARARITAFTYAKGPNRGVSFALESVQFVRDGERFGKGVDVDFPDDLDASSDDTMEHLNAAGGDYEEDDSLV